MPQILYPCCLLHLAMKHRKYTKYFNLRALLVIESARRAILVFPNKIIIINETYRFLEHSRESGGQVNNLLKQQNIFFRKTPFIFFKGVATENFFKKIEGHNFGASNELLLAYYLGSLKNLTQQ